MHVRAPTRALTHSLARTRTHTRTRTDPKGFFRNQNPLFAQIFYAISQAVGVGENNDFAGSALAYMAVDPAMDGKTGGWFDALPLGKHSLAKHSPSIEAQDKDKQAKLWELSSALLEEEGGGKERA